MRREKEEGGKEMKSRIGKNGSKKKGIKEREDNAQIDDDRQGETRSE